MTKATTKSDRAGRYVQQATGYKAFLPARLPPEPEIQLDKELLKLLSDADRALGRLDGVASTLPNPDLFVAMYVRQEAVLSSQIEGTQSSLDDVLVYEVEGRSKEHKDVAEVFNYVGAMRYGLGRLPQLPLSLRLLREVHEVLLRGVRGGEVVRTPGEFRKSQNWSCVNAYSWRRVASPAPGTFSWRHLCSVMFEFNQQACQRRDRFIVELFDVFDVDVDAGLDRDHAPTSTACGAGSQPRARRASRTVGSIARGMTRLPANR